MAFYRAASGGTPTITKTTQTLSQYVSVNHPNSASFTLTFSNLSSVDGISAVTMSNSSGLPASLTSLSISGNKVTIGYRAPSASDYGGTYTGTFSVTAFKNVLNN